MCVPVIKLANVKQVTAASEMCRVSKAAESVRARPLVASVGVRLAEGIKRASRRMRRSPYHAIALKGNSSAHAAPVVIPSDLKDVGEAT